MKFISIIMLIVSCLLGVEGYSQDCGNPRFEFKIEGKNCVNDGKATVTVNIIADGNSNIELSANTRFIVYNKNNQKVAESALASYVINNVPQGGPYRIVVGGVKCNGSLMTNLPPIENLMITLGMKLTKAEYQRCTASDIRVDAKVEEGIGPYLYQIISEGNVIYQTETASSSFAATGISSDNILLKVTDKGCAGNAPQTLTMSKTLDYSTIASLALGDRDICFGGTLDLTVPNDIPISNCQWKKNGTTIATSKNLKIENVTAANAGNYDLLVTIDNCGSYSETVTVNVGTAAAPTIAPAYPCLNSPQFTIDKYVTKTADSYTLIWYKSDHTLIGATAPAFNPNTVGTYTYYVTQKNAGGCESNKIRLDLIVGNPPAAIGANNVQFCYDPLNPDPKMVIINATNNYTYNLYSAYSGGTLIASGTAINDTAYLAGQNLVIGNRYYVETVNENGCTSTSRTTITVNVKEKLILGQEKICFGGTLVLTADYPGGNIVWTKPDNSTYTGKTLTIDNVDYNAGGIYKLFIEESGLGCTMRDMITVAVTRPDAPVPTPASYRYAQNAAAAPMTATAKTGNTLKWYSPDGNLLSGQSPVPATTQLGTFTYQVSQDSAGCESAKAAVTVVIGEVPSPVPASDVKICIAEKPVINIANTSSNYQYTVYNHATNDEIAQGTGNGGTLSLTSNVVIANNMAIAIVVTDAYGVKSEKTTVNVVSINNLIDKQQSTAQVCKGSTAILKAVSIDGATYKWTLPDGTTATGQTLSISNAGNTHQGQYTLTVEQASCQPAVVQTQLRVTQPATPVAAPATYRYAQNATATAMTATAKTGHTLKWYSPDGNLLSGQSPVPSTTQIGSFVYKVSQDSAGCESEKVSVSVTVGPVPNPVPASDVNICIDDKPVIHISNTINNYTYAVYDNGDRKIAEGKGNGATISLTSIATITAEMNLEIVVSDIYNVNSERTPKHYIPVNKMIDAQNSTASVCEGSTAKFVAVTIAGASYTWIYPDGRTENAQSSEILNVAAGDAGTYFLEVTTAGCAAVRQKFTLTIAKPANPVADTGIYYCVGATATPLQATALPGYKLVWFDAANNTLTAAPTPNTSTAGRVDYYVMQESLSDRLCTSDKEKITVHIEAIPDAVTLPPVNVCANAGVVVSVTIPSTQNGYKYSLYDKSTGGTLLGDIVGDGNTASIDVVAGLLNTPLITYYLQITSKAGCSTVARTPVNIEVTSINISPDRLPQYEIDEYYSESLITNISNPIFSIVEGYLPTGLVLSSLGIISGTVSATEDPAEFVVEVATRNGCAERKTYLLKGDVQTSKMFSPNGDGINDVFMKGYKITVFDRHGRKLFAGENGWDGTHNGKMMPEDVYYYILYSVDKEGKERKVTGYTTLIKNM
ncbi:MAG: gliding motility-associated C-terminal domain-containing protein [Prevotellaceae bacterium]|nr:gliding motility-associated C-terminal domain-containing protein [Prevotellaceae bacterium]